MNPATEVYPFKGTTSIDFIRRARHYRLAAAVTDIQRDVEVYIELAMMFDEIAYAFQRIETNLKHSASTTRNSK